jgi:type II secretory pathway pseudopilin PulG
MRVAGFTYIALLAAIIILGVSMTVATKYWQNIIVREKEEELLFRGEEYIKAIESYRKASPGLVKKGAASIDELLTDPRSPGKHHLRRKYKDPITGEDFVVDYGVIAGQTKQIIGVHSSSDKEPLKQSNFQKTPHDFSGFEGKKKYSEWLFTVDQQALDIPAGSGQGITLTKPPNP